MKISKLLPFFSYVFHPIFISIYGTLLYFLLTQNVIYETQLYLTLIQVGILTLLLPLALYFLFVSLGVIDSFTEATIKERRIPLTIQVVLFFILIKFSVSLTYLPELYYFFLGGLISSCLALISVLLNYKASLHMIGITSLACFTYALCVYYQLGFVNIVAFVIVCIGLVASSRLYMKSHNVNELIIGSLIGIIPQVALWYFWL